ncbi:MAG TPA: hypothetical protein VMZ26_07645 [Pyrinomonadaceae bacterium]|nr:hypothetical protein [Pyrinomonadaceae bacterium]
MKRNKRATIYVYLLDDGTDAWRPVDAIHVGGDHYKITNPPIAGENWEFGPGSTVRCRKKVGADNAVFLAAFEKVPE